MTSNPVGRTYTVTCPRCGGTTRATLTGHALTGEPIWWVRCLCVPAYLTIRNRPAHVSTR